MRTTTRTLGLLALALLAGRPRAQAEATTLANLCRSTAVVTATAVAATDPSPAVHRVAFRTDELLRGAAPATFELAEPAGHCCGRALFAMLPGTGVLLFLEPRGTGFELAGGSRGAVLVNPALLAHVRALLAATTEAQLGRVLAGATLAADPRVRVDACLHLATLATMPADAASRAAVRAAVLDAADRCSATLPALVTATVRIGGDDAAVTLLRPFLAATRADVGTVLRAGLLQFADDQVLGATLAVWPAQDLARERVATLLRELEPAAARPLALRLLHEAESPRAALAACEALLGLGLAAEDLRKLAPGPVVQLALRRQAAPPQYRNVRREALR